LTNETTARTSGESEDELLLQRLKGSRIPRHMAVIPDGNRRWAEERGLMPVQGHRRGFEVSKSLSRFCRKVGIHTFTVWAFSTENWKRPPVEVGALMALFEEWLRDLLPEAVEEEVRVIHVGRKEGLPAGAFDAATAAGFPNGLPDSLKAVIEEVEQKTAGFERNVINLAVNYGGGDEIQRAIQKLLDHADRTRLHPMDLQIVDFLDTAGQVHPFPDLIWRTSGELRLSGFMPLQSSYAEFAFTGKHFPDLEKVDLIEAVEEYSRRVRRFGG
jgi:undecaprenyl diphosphate synthase